MGVGIDWRQSWWNITLGDISGGAVGGGGAMANGRGISAGPNVRWWRGGGGGARATLRATVVYSSGLSSNGIANVVCTHSAQAKPQRYYGQSQIRHARAWSEKQSNS